MKKILISFAAIIAFSGVAALALRFISPEDAWVCQNGQWARHGNPASTQPQSGCGTDPGPAAEAISNQPAIGNNGEEFIRSGVAGKNLPGLDKDKLYLIYDEPANPEQKLELKFTVDSTCAYGGSQGRRILCALLSVSDYGLANGRSITVIGTKQDSVLLVKEIQMEPLAYGNSSWEEIRQALGACRVKQVFQAHSLEVSATLKDGSVLTAREPAIDDIIDEAAAAEPRCGKIIMATE